MSEKKTRSRKSLAEQISSLSDPKPTTSFHPDQEFLGDDTAAKVCDFTYEDDPSVSPTPRVRSSRAGARIKRHLELEEDPKYAGRVVSRKELEADSGEGDRAMHEIEKLMTFTHFRFFI